MVKVPKSLIGFYYTQMRQEGITKSSDIANQLLTTKGILGVNYAISGQE